MKIVINKCFGGFGLSEAAYTRLIELGVPVQAYIEQKRDQETRRYEPEPRNDGQVIFDRTLTPGATFCDPEDIRLQGRYWDAWTRDDENRAHPLVVQVVEELGAAASGELSKLAVVEVPDDVEWSIDGYDGVESIHEAHRSWS